MRLPVAVHRFKDPRGLVVEAGYLRVYLWARGPHRVAWAWDACSLWTRVARRLPRDLAYFTVLRVLAAVTMTDTTGDPFGLTVDEVLRRWDGRHPTVDSAS